MSGSALTKFWPCCERSGRSDEFLRRLTRRGSALVLLIKNKLAAGRPQDLVDAERLRETG
jgi:hypothetical protein